MQESGLEALLNIVGAVALLIWGAHTVREAAIAAFGPWLRRLIARRTRGAPGALATGIALSGVLQSSLASALLLASFRDFPRTSSALMLVLGADLGASLTGQLLGLNVDWIGPALAIIGVVAGLFGTSETSKSVGQSIVGVGLIFISIGLLHSAVTPLQGSETIRVIFEALIREAELSFVIGIGLALLFQSSLVVAVFVMSLATAIGKGEETVICMMLGANLGSACLPIVLARDARPIIKRAFRANIMMRGTLACFLLPAAPIVAPLHVSVLVLHLLFNMVVVGVCAPIAALFAWRLDRGEGRRIENADPLEGIDSDGERGVSATALAEASRRVVFMSEAAVCMMREAAGVLAGGRHDRSAGS